MSSNDQTPPLSGQALLDEITDAIVTLHLRHRVGPDLAVELFLLEHEA